MTLTGIGAIDGAGIEGALVSQAATVAAKADVIAAVTTVAASATAAAADGSGAPGGLPSGGSTAPLEGEVLVVESDQYMILVDKSQRLVVRCK